MLVQASRIVCLAILWATALISRVDAQPDWCRYAKSNSERTICTTPRLWEIDGCEDGIFNAVRSREVSSRRQALEQQERAWVVERDRCGTDVACIAQRYSERALALDPIAGSQCRLQTTTTAASKQSPAKRCLAQSELEALALQTRVTTPATGTIFYAGRSGWELAAYQPRRVPMTPLCAGLGMLAVSGRTGWKCF